MMNKKNIDGCPYNKIKSSLLIKKKNLVKVSYLNQYIFKVKVYINYLDKYRLNSTDSANIFLLVNRLKA